MVEILNAVQICEENQHVIAETFDKTQNFSISKSSMVDNKTQILFPDKTKNLNGYQFKVAYFFDNIAVVMNVFDHTSKIPICKWTYYFDILAEQLNATIKFVDQQEDHKYDLHLNYFLGKYDLECYNSIDYCFLVALPDSYSITELVLVLPLDLSCWIWFVECVQCFTK